MASGFLPWGDHSEGPDGAEEVEDELQEQFSGSKDCLIFAIDCSESMFRPRDNAEESWFELSIRCSKNVLSNKIISSDKDLIGVVFFATEKHRNSSDFNHVYVLQELDTPDAQRILELEEILEGN
jgi:ATP-dependent DNA helicase 2 subunit 1